MSIKFCFHLEDGQKVCWDVPVLVSRQLSPPDPTQSLLVSALGPGPHPWLSDLIVLSTVNAVLARLSNRSLAESLRAVVRDGVSDLSRQLPAGLTLDLQDQFAADVSA